MGLIWMRAAANGLLTELKDVGRRVLPCQTLNMSGKDISYTGTEVPVNGPYSDSEVLILTERMLDIWGSGNAGK